MIESQNSTDESRTKNEKSSIFRTEITVPINQSDDDTDDLVILRDAKGQINRSAYARLHKLSTTSENRLSTANLNKYEKFTRSPINRSDSHLCVKPKKNDVKTNKIAEKRKENDDADSVDSIPCVIRKSESTDTVDKIEQELSNFVMDKKKDKKRSNSFRKLFSVSFFGKDKKKKATPKDDVIRHENSDYTENYQNETQFARNTPQRHTIGCDHYKNRSNFAHPPPPPPTRTIEEDPPPEVVRQYANFHINKFNKIRNSFEESNETTIEHENLNNGNVAHPFVTKYIDTSSSTNTLESEKLNVQQAKQDIAILDDKFKLVRNDSFRRETPPRAQETRQIVNIVKPKARLPPAPINTVQNQPQLNDLYGTVFDAIPHKPRSPRSPSLEMTKLKLPSNREITTLQPRLRSPSPYTRVSTEKLIATELLKTKNDEPRKPQPQATSTPEIQPAVSDAITALRNELETNDQNLKQELNQIRNTLQSLNLSEVESPRGTLGSRSSVTASPLPRLSEVELRQKPSRPSTTTTGRKTPNSPSKDEIRRSVEAYYWKEIKRIKEKEDYDIYMSQLHYSRAGFAEDPICSRRSRGYDDNRNRRSSSVPRNVQRTINFDTNDSRSVVIPEGRTVVYGYVNNTRPNYGTYKPIFRRGSLSGSDYQPMGQGMNKKVSFSNSQQAAQNWPTKNGFTKSPPQRRLDRVPNTTLDDDVFLPNNDNYAIYASRIPNYSSDSEAIYGHRQFRRMNHQELENLRNSQLREMNGGFKTRHESLQEQPYGYLPYGESRRGSYYEPQRSRIPVRRDIVITDNVYGQHVGYRNDYGYANANAEPLYASRPKQVTVRNKVCDMYGNIHDTGNIQTGVLMGQLQQSPTSPQNFRRGTRLTASHNDMLRTRQDYRENETHPHAVRPLPPLPPTGKNDKNAKKNQPTKKKKK